MSRILYYATPDDLKNVLRSVDEKLKLKYCQCKSFTEEEFSNIVKVDSLLDYPNIGYAKSGKFQDCILVSQQDEPLQVEIYDSDVGKRFYPAPLLNAPSVMWYLGGLWEDDMILYGEVNTAMTDEQSKKMFSTIKRIIKKQFTRVGVFYIGPEAFSDRTYKLLRFSAAEPEKYHFPRE